MSKTYSVVECIDLSGYEYSKQMAWAVGKRISREWRSANNGEAPAYEMKPKRSGGAPKHLKAVYPAGEWCERIHDIVVEYANKHHPKPTNMAEHVTTDLVVPVGRGYQLVRESLEVLTGDQHRLVWVFDLVSDLGTPDMPHDTHPVGYHDCRAYELFERLVEVLREHHPFTAEYEWTGDNVDALIALVTLPANTFPNQTTPAVYPVDLQLPHEVVVDKLTIHPPPIGSWQIVSNQMVQGLGLPLPASFFMDAIPF